MSAYCLPRNLRKKSVDELRELADAGLAIAYIGAESGDDEVLDRVNKGETFASTADALDKLGAAGIRRSVMILNGLGGRALSAQHADNSARLANATQPEYLATLVVSFPRGETRFRRAIPGVVAAVAARAVRRDGALPLGARPPAQPSRSDHASNWLVLRGTLGADKQRLLDQVRQAIAAPESAPLRPAWARGL